MEADMRVLIFAGVGFIIGVAIMPRISIYNPLYPFVLPIMVIVGALGGLALEAYYKYQRH
jgi:hypothetical protein